MNLDILRNILPCIVIIAVGCANLESHDSANVSTEQSGATVLLVGMAAPRGISAPSPVPKFLQTASYTWDTVPVTGSNIQMIRACSYYNDIWKSAGVNATRWWCWDHGKGKLLQYVEGEALRNFNSAQEVSYWLIGNEPDFKSQDNLTPEEYAKFYGVVAATLLGNEQDAKKRLKYTRLIFCQIANPRSDYCERAYRHLLHLVQQQKISGWPENLHPAETIYAISIHAYTKTYQQCTAGSKRCYGSTLTEEALPKTILDWQEMLTEFSQRMTILDGGRLASKPLWITELGALYAFCPASLPFRDEVDVPGGESCPEVALRNDGLYENDYVFYGRNPREGLWGLQNAQFRYFAEHSKVGTKRQRWERVWWFAQQINRSQDERECVSTGWLFGDNVDCSKHQLNYSPAALSLRRSLLCAFEMSDCKAGW